MVLARLLEGIRVSKLFAMTYGKTIQQQDIDIRTVQYDSRKVQRGDLFVAICGTVVDGHAFIERAIENGAVAVVLERDDAVHDSLFLHTGVMKIVVPDSRKALALLAAAMNGHPSRQMRLIGVTGTNGKTTTTHLLKAILEAAGATVGLVGTIEYKIGDRIVPATHTTPESLELSTLLADMVSAGCTAAVMEVSSHALVMDRVYGLEFDAGVFTNLTQDHLDFHGTMEQYFRAKKILFDGLQPGAKAVTNADDSYGTAIVASTRAQTIRYGATMQTDVRVTDIKMGIEGVACTVMEGTRAEHITSTLTGRFNVANILAACATGVALGIPWNAIQKGIRKVTTVRGRFEKVRSPAGWTAIVDYAHTPDALENCLRTIREVLPPDRGGKVITVFGCGGDRDAGKRPIMGRIASALSDVVIITSDNPRTEDPSVIVRQILMGVKPEKSVFTEVDRRAAIRMSLTQARPGDVVLVAGKGHEDYQVIGTNKTHFDDREEIEAFILGAG
jgi:UDP-N-acetylmuramoyl-L-alanyl-D-glutamate--2,6-diaminopimelate ligase